MLRMGVKWNRRGCAFSNNRAHEDLYLPEVQLSKYKSALDRGELRTKNDGRIAEISSLENEVTATRRRKGAKRRQGHSRVWRGFPPLGKPLIKRRQEPGE